MGAGRSAASGAAASAFSDSRLVPAVLGQEDRAEPIAIRVRIGQPRRLQRLPPGAGRTATRRTADQSSRKADSSTATASGRRLQPPGELGGLQGVEVQPRGAEGGGIGGVGAVGADVLLIGPDLDQLLPQPGVALRPASSPAWISPRRAAT